MAASRAAAAGPSRGRAEVASRRGSRAAADPEGRRLGGGLARRAAPGCGWCSGRRWKLELGFFFFFSLMCDSIYVLIELNV